MNVLTDPALFRDLQGNTPPQWASAGTFLFPVSGSVPQGIVYTGAAFKLPASMLISVVTVGGVEVPSLVVTSTSPTLGDTTTTTVLPVNGTTPVTITLPQDATTFTLGVTADGEPFTDDVQVQVVPVSAVDRVYPPNEIGRVMTAYVSAYERDRVHVSNLYANQTARLTANFNGALQLERVLASATWQTYGTPQAFMSEAEIGEKQASILVACGYAGPAVIKCTVTLDNGEKLVQQFRLNVLSQPYYTGDIYPSNGPQSLTVDA